MITQPAITNGVTARGFTPEQRQLVKNTVAAGATDLELDYFLQFCAAKGFDPFAKEAWFIKTKGFTGKDGREVEGRVQIMTGIEGFFKIANIHPQFDGMDHEYGPDIRIPVNASKAPGVKEIVAPEWVETAVYRKDRGRPEKRKCYWREYAQELVTYGGKLSLWAQKPTMMLEKCADATALRKAFPQELNDIRTPEEMPREYSADDEERKTAAEIESQQRANYLAQRTARIEQSNDYVIEFGNSGRGKKVSEATNSIWLERHLAKYADQIPDAGKKLIEARVAELKREHAKKNAAVVEVVEGDDGWHPSEDEAAEIARLEREGES